jgi:aspartate-semialdehyde dehydrogenase
LAKHHSHRTSIALVGGETLLGRDLRELLRSAGLPEPSLFAVEGEQTGILTQERGEPAVMAPLASATLTSGLLLLAGTPDSAAKALEIVKRSGTPPVVIDVAGALEDDPSARLRAPMLEAPDHRASSPIQVIAHPAAVSLALLLRRLHGAGAIQRAVILVFEPASERGQPGLDELQKQTVGLLSFKKLSKDVFDAQIAFNMLPRFGEDAPTSLEEIELKIDRHLASLLASAGNIPMPSLRLVQAPVFHGYSFSLWVEFGKNPGPEKLAASLAAPHIEVRAGDEESPSNVGVAGQSGITVGEISTDRNNPRACWVWAVADNLRIAAENAVEVVREALA